MSEHPRKIGTMQTVDMNTGEVRSTKQNAMTLLPAAPGLCPECATEHGHAEPHNQQSLFYQMRFHGTHGRWPTWTDTMSHCSPEVRRLWREHLIALMREKGIEVPADLLGDPTEAPQGGR